MSNRNFRGKTQKMYLLGVEYEANQWNMTLQGLTNQYTITIGKDKVECSCPDFNNRKNVCKHLYFIFSQVAQYYEGDLVLSTIESSGDQTTNNIKLNDKVFNGLSEKLTSRLRKRMEVAKETKTNLEPETECVICFESIEPDEKLFQCVKQCKKYCHDACIKIWTGRGQNTCPYCRATINEDKSNKTYDPLDKFTGLKISTEPPKDVKFVNDYLNTVPDFIVNFDAHSKKIQSFI